MLKKLVKQQLQVLQEIIRRPIRERELRNTARSVSPEEIRTDLLRLGITAGDTVFLHSSLKSLGYIPGGPMTVLNCLRGVLGDEGTLIVPTYHIPGGTIYGTCQIEDYVFDPRTAGTKLGALPAAFLKMPGIERSIHPTHSVSAIGKHARFITEAHPLAPSVFGEGSPWERCWQLDGKILGLGVSMGPVTFYHMLEDRLGNDFPLPVRMNTTFQMRCRDWTGEPLTVPVVPLDPQFMPRRIDNPSREDLRGYFWQEFESAGLLRSGKVGEGRAWFVPSRAFLEHLERLARQGITIYSTAEELADHSRRS